MAWTSYVLFVILLIALNIQLWAYVQLYHDFKTNLKNDVIVLDVVKLKFEGYVKDFNKKYHGKEYERRFENFKASLKDIARSNALEGNTVFGLTKFSDMSKQEFVDTMLLPAGRIAKCQERNPTCVSSQTHRGSSTNRKRRAVSQPSFDWRSKGVVKPVLNQRRCRGCWAFSIVGVIESMSAIRKLDNESRSIQELLDCSKYTNGCYNGSVGFAMSYICLNHLEFVTEDEYPMTLSLDKDCVLSNLTRKKNRRGVSSYYYQCHVADSSIVNQVVEHGPLVAAVDASNWLNYIGGVIRWACSRGNSNHVVQIVGYEKSNVTAVPYYIIRNSMGEDFGDKGYVKIAMYDNVCGISDQVTSIDVV